MSKCVHAAVHTRKTIGDTLLFLREMAVRFPFRIHTILTDNGAQFAYRLLADARRPAGEHPFDLACRELGIKHRLTQFRHPWTNGQNERFNRTLKEGTVKKFHYANQTELAAHLKLFLRACNMAKRLRAIGHLTPHENCWNFTKRTPHYSTESLSTLDRTKHFAIDQSKVNTITHVATGMLFLINCE